MDIYNYLNSKDVAEHCRSINYEFNSLEKAFIINDCISIDIEEKHRLYREIMATEKDVEVPKQRLLNEYDKSFFAAFDKHIKYEEECIDTLKKGGDNIVYTYKFRSEYEREYCESRTIYSSYEKAREAMVEELKDFFEDEPDTRLFGEITMHRLDMDGHIYADMDQNGNIINILGCLSDVIYELFEEFWVYIPVPFKKGDILTSSITMRNEKMVLTSVCYWNKSEEKIEFHKQHSDSMDMVAYGFWTDETGHLYDECSHEYHNLTYYTGELKGNDRILKAVSAHMKGEIDEAMMLIAYEAVLNENAMKNTFPGWDYLEECYE